MFWCDSCNHAETYTYTLPVLREDVSKNLIMALKNPAFLLKHGITLSDSLLTERINLSESNIIAQKGLSWALADLQQKNVLYGVDGFSFYVTLLGHLLLWHGPY